MFRVQSVAMDLAHLSEIGCIVTSMWSSSICGFLLPVLRKDKTYKPPLPSVNFSPTGASSFPSPPTSALRLHSAAAAIMSEKRRSGSIDKASGSDVHEKGLDQDIVSVITPPSSLLSHASPQGALAEEMQALGPDLLEATAHAKNMTPEEVEETIDYLLNEVNPFQPMPRTLYLYFESNTARERSR